MNDLTEFLFPAPARRSVPAIVRWWEGRRLAYNLIVGGAGLVSVGAIHLLAVLPPFSHPARMPWQAPVVFGVMANVCYFLGPTVEGALHVLWRDRLLPVGPALYRMGLTFSVGLALLPTLLFIFEWLFRMLRWIA